MFAWIRTIVPMMVLAASMAAMAQARAEASMAPQQVAPGVYYVMGEAALGSPANRNFISNAGFVVTQDSVVVIDALGSPALAEQLVAEIRRITPKPIRQIDHRVQVHAQRRAQPQRLHGGGRHLLGSRQLHLREPEARAHRRQPHPARLRLRAAERSRRVAPAGGASLIPLGGCTRKRPS